MPTVEYPAYDVINILPANKWTGQKSLALAVGNIKQSQVKQTLDHDNQYQLQSFVIEDKCKMEQQLRDIQTYIQRLAAILEPDEIVILDQDCIILHTQELEASEQIVPLERRTPAEKFEKTYQPISKI
ncbi:38010_t:CDS:2 [Gigaspora margarita]|uniref:38010_t:CDS:1 n=1 Tax=Gigaspora margarita TaxID=4874 RepID=A0ABN7WTW2_GIGMA|nr:38010_t:CDS:2 [Gigaspora margarita]